MPQLESLFAEHRQALLWISGTSALVFVASLVLVPWLVVRAPHDFFTREERARAGSGPLWAVLRNLFGALFVVGGVLMLVLPGQGILTLLLGVSLLDFPGKRRLMRRVAQQPKVWHALSYLRERAHRPPFERP